MGYVNANKSNSDTILNGTLTNLKDDVKNQFNHELNNQNLRQIPIFTAQKNKVPR